MCPKIFGVLFLTLLITYLPAQVKIGDNPSVQDPSAILELEKSDMGLLITRVYLADVWDNLTIPYPADGLLVYNLNFGGGPDPVNPGFYYWREDLGKWIRLQTETGSAVGDIWIDENENILSVNSAQQNLSGLSNVALGNGSFGDLGDPSNYVVAIGEGACNSETTAGDAYVVALGYNTAYSNSGNYLNAMGYQSAWNNSGENVNALGYQACQNNTGNAVNAMGFFAAHDNTEGNVNAFGPGAALQNSAFIVNALGPDACQQNSGASVNGMGHNAAKENSGSEVNAFGAMAAQFNNQSSLNALGNTAAQHNEGWSVNALGFQAAQYNKGSDVHAFGQATARFNDGNNCIAIGENALYGDTLVTEGPGNIGIGYHAASDIGTGANNIAIGNDVHLIDGDANNQINIGGSIIRDEFGVIQLDKLIQLTPTTTPSVPVAGMIYFDSSDNTLYCYDGAFWQALW